MFDSIQESFRRQGFVRVRDGRVLGGVLAGIGQRLGMGAWRTRALFILLLLLIPGSQLVVYPILWLLMPMSTAAPVELAAAGTVSRAG